MSRSLMYDVAAMVIHLKTADVNGLADKFPGKTKYQIQKALHNAGTRGLIHAVRHGHQSYWTAGKVALPEPPKPQPKPEIRARSSVFDLGGVLVPQERGQLLAPLGGWD